MVAEFATAVTYWVFGQISTLIIFNRIVQHCHSTTVALALPSFVIVHFLLNESHLPLYVLCSGILRSQTRAQILWLPNLELAPGLLDRVADHHSNAAFQILLVALLLVVADFIL